MLIVLAQRARQRLSCAPQCGQVLDSLPERHSRRRSVQRNHCANSSVAVGDGNRETYRSFKVFADVGSNAIRADLFERFLQSIDARDRALGVTFERARPEDPAQLDRRHLRQKQFSACGAMQRHSRARIHVQPHRR